MQAINPYHFALATPLLMACMALMCVITWRNYRTHRYLLWMALNQGSLAIALTGQTLLRTEHAYISTLWVTALYLSSSIGLTRAMHLRLGRSTPTWPLLAITSTCLVVMWHFLVQAPNIPARMTTVSLGMAAILWVGLPRLWSAPKRHKLDVMCLGIYSLTALITLLRPLLLLESDGGASAAPVEHSLIWWFSLVSMLLLSIGMTISLVGSAMLDMQHLLRQERDHDKLTGLLNRRAFEEMCAPIPYNQGIRALVACDVDHFKRINDTHGHLVGDAVLQAFGPLLRRHVRKGDIVARIGGEEFVIALRHSGLGHAEQVAQRIHAALHAQAWQAPHLRSRLPVTASLGVVQVRPGESLHHALDRADALLYAAKRSGRNRIQTEHTRAR